MVVLCQCTLCFIEKLFRVQYGAVIKALVRALIEGKGMSAASFMTSFNWMSGDD